MQSLIFKDTKAAIRLLAISLCAMILPHAVSADTYRSGQHIEPAFEGWKPNADGSFNMMFGYMNENWEEELDVPIGADNSFHQAMQIVVNLLIFYHVATALPLK